MAGGVYITWVASALALGILLLPVFKPKWQKVNLQGFIDMFRRYWAHIGLVFSIYVWKDILDQLDRLIMANTQFEFTPWVYAIEGDLVLWVQQAFLNDLLTTLLTHFYVAGYMLVCYVSVLYFCYFDDRYIADRVSMSIFYVYAFAVPFYLFLNVRVTGDHIPAMETLAYNLTPEINDWFTRIDPFTNGMPSLHIGIPFAVWLSLIKWDSDKRWRNYTNFLAVFIVLTAFAVVYLGIHWYLDIIGGMLIALLAVQASEKSQWLWKILDERTFNARLVTVLTSKERTVYWAKTHTKRLWYKLKSPSSRETSVAMLMVVLLTVGVIVWDVTHRELPATGVESPVEATAADGWLVNLDNSSEGWKVVVTDLSDLTQDIPIEHQQLDRNSTFDTGWDMLAIANDTVAQVYNLAEPSIQPWILNVSQPSQLYLAEWLGQGIVLLVVEEGELRGMTLDGDVITMPAVPVANASVTSLAVHDNRLAIIYDDEPALVRLGRVGLDSLADQPLQYYATTEENALLESWGQVVDEGNATIVEVDLDYDWLVATVNVSAVDRLVLVDLERGESRLISDAKFPAHDPAVGHGLVVWASQWNLNPSNPQDEYLDHEIWYLDLESGAVNPEHLTNDELEQRQPSVLANHITWITTDEEGNSVTTIHPRTVALDTYSSQILQFAVLAMIILTGIFSWQKMTENAAPKVNGMVDNSEQE